MKELNITWYNTIIKRVHCARLHGMTYHDFGFGSWASGLQLLPLAVVVSMGSGPLGHSATPWLHDDSMIRYTFNIWGEIPRLPMNAVLQYSAKSSKRSAVLSTLQLLHSSALGLRAKFEVEIIVHVAVHVCSMAIPSLLSFDDTRTQCQSLCPSLSISKPQNGSSFWVRSSFQLS